MELTFWGAVKTVTGSMHELEAGWERHGLDVVIPARGDSFQLN